MDRQLERVHSFFEQEIENKVMKLPTENDEAESEIDEQPTFDHEDIEDSDLEDDSFVNQRYMPQGADN